MRTILIIILLIASKIASGQQEHKATVHAEHQSMKGSHRLTIGLGHSHISQGIINGETEWVTAGFCSFN
jgi:hypothetical protein